MSTQIGLVRRMGLATALFSVVPIFGCHSANRHEPMPTVDYVDIERFQGRWYVIAAKPTLLERGMTNAVEHYEVSAEGRIRTTFTFNRGSFDGPEKRFNASAFIKDPNTNALWSMQFIWPFRAEYRIVHLDETYQHTIIGRSKRDYVWIMSRSPAPDGQTIEQLLTKATSIGYRRTDIRRIPHETNPQSEP